MVTFMPTYIADSYAWLEYFDGNPAYGALIDENQIKTPSSVFAEVSRVFSRNKRPEKDRLAAVKFMSDKSILIPLDKELAVRAGVISESEKLYLLDAMAYACASEGEPLLSGDEHFKGKKNVLFVK